MCKKISGRKGISVFVSHILAIAILFVILTVVSVSLFNYYHSVKEESQRSQALVLSQRVADNVLKLYTSYKDSDYELETTNETLSEVYLNIPEKISGSSYILSLEQHGDFWIEGEMEDESPSHNERPYTSVKVETENPYAVYNYPIYNIVSVNVSGSVRRATKIKLSYVRESGEDFIIMERFS